MKDKKLGNNVSPLGNQSTSNPTRRLFLKRTGGAGVAASLLLTTNRSVADENHDESEEWVMKYVDTLPAPSPYQTYSESWPIKLVDDNDVEHDLTLTIGILTSVAEDQDLSDTNQIDYSVAADTQIHDPNINERAYKSFDVSVVCPEENGHLTQTVTPTTAGGPVPGSHEFEFGGVTYNITMIALVLGVSNPDEHTLESKCAVHCTVYRYIGAVELENTVEVGRFPTEDPTDPENGLDELNVVVTSTFNSYEK